MLQRVLALGGAALASLLLCLLALPLVAAPWPTPSMAQSSDGLPSDGLPSDATIPPLSGGAPAERPGAFVEAAPATAQTTAAPAIDLWYSATLPAGHNGDPQKWVNVLGNVASAAPLASLTYRLNDGPALPLAVGPDDMRLARAGDFNIELDYTDLRAGANRVVIRAADQTGAATEATVTIDYRGGGIVWQPRTYVFDWATATRIDDLAQVVDGHWVLDGGGVRPTVFDFDRLLALGDLSWRDYTVTVPITVFGIDEDGYKAPSNGPGVGVMVRWQGHYDAGNGASPRTGWRRLGALGWYRWQKVGENYSEGFQLLGHTGRELGTFDRPLALGQTYLFKLAVQSNADPAIPATYRFKVWPATAAEPAAWDVEKRGFAGEPSGGGLLLVAHHVDARFGAVRVDLATVRPRPSLTIITNGAGRGRVVTTPDGPTFRFGQDVALTGAPDLGSLFLGWDGAATGTTNPTQTTLFESATITATFGLGGNGIALPIIVANAP